MVEIFQYLGLGAFDQWNDEFFRDDMFNCRNREIGDVLAWRIAEEGCTKVDAIWLAGEGIGDHPSNTDEFIVPLHYQNRYTKWSKHAAGQVTQLETQFMKGTLNIRHQQHEDYDRLVS